MTSKTETEKLETLLNYWIKHNNKHCGDYRMYAEKAKDSGFVEVHDYIIESCRQMEKADEFLLMALEKLGKGMP